MSSRKRAEERLYHLLPAIYRRWDMDEGEPLRALMAVIEEQMNSLESDIQGLYENWFIETCQEWVLPYIGDLLGMRPLRRPIAASTSINQRAHVANTQAYRRRKGTAFVLEQAARDATGWPVRIQEFFPLLAMVQNINHIRPRCSATIDLKDARRLEQLGSPFEEAAHTAEVGIISNGVDRYNIKNIGLFFWRLNSYAVTKGDAGNSTSNCPACLSFSPLGLDMPLFNRAWMEQDVVHLSEEINVPGRLSRLALDREIKNRRASLEKGEPPAGSYFGEDPVFQIFLDDKAVKPEEMAICSLEDGDISACNFMCGQENLKIKKERSEDLPQEYGLKVAVDPQLGRLMLLNKATGGEDEKGTAVQVSYSYGFSGEVGGGPYNRKNHLGKWLDFSGWNRLKDDEISPEKRILVQVASRRWSLNQALSQWKDFADNNVNSIGLIIIEGSRNIGSDSGKTIQIEMPAESRLAIIAGYWPSSAAGKWLIEDLEPQGVWPCFKADLKIMGQMSSELILDGLLIDGRVELASSIGRLRFSDCTLYPRSGGLFAREKAEGSAIEMQSCICGQINLENEFSRLDINESIIDGMGGAAISAKRSELRLLSSTVLGSTAVLAAQAENSIFTARLAAERLQSGCIRFSYLPQDSITPRRYHCQPDRAIDEAKKIEGRELSEEKIKAVIQRLAPTFTSVHYGHPGFCQLSCNTPKEILSGSEQGSEMGAFSTNRQPEREADLRDCLDEYLPLGLNAGIFYVD